MPSETNQQHDAFYQAQTHGNKQGVGAGKNSLVHCASLSIDEEPMYCRATSIICTIGLFVDCYEILTVLFACLFTCKFCTLFVLQGNVNHLLYWSVS